jgi:hypothetical protein
MQFKLNPSFLPLLLEDAGECVEVGCASATQLSLGRSFEEEKD